jgi:hypothetical protein
MNWASAYRFVTNPLIVYTDSEDFYKFMMKVRTDFQKKTKIFKICQCQVGPKAGKHYHILHYSENIQCQSMHKNRFQNVYLE